MNLVLTTRRPAARPSHLATAAVRAAGHVAFAALVAFHVWLLGLHLLDGRALQPATAARWGLAALVLVGFRALSRRNLPLFRGRRAVVLWLLVVILHCSGAWNGGAARLEHGIPEAVSALAQLSTVAIVLGATFACAIVSTPRRWAGGRPAFFVPVPIAGLPPSGFIHCFSPRPPPLA
jgi:hypothetical protein